MSIIESIPLLYDSQIECISEAIQTCRVPATRKRYKSSHGTSCEFLWTGSSANSTWKFKSKSNGFTSGHNCITSYENSLFLLLFVGD